MDTEFQDDDPSSYTIRPRKQRPRQGTRLGPKDLNSVYIGKHVIVVNKSQFKGYRGIIKNTSPDGRAWVELEATLIAHQRTQVIKLEHLGM